MPQEKKNKTATSQTRSPSNEKGRKKIIKSETTMTINNKAEA